MRLKLPKIKGWLPDEYPRFSGGATLLGPQTIADEQMTVINHAGVNYYREGASPRSDIDIAGLRKLASEASQGSWEVDYGHSHMTRGCRCGSCSDPSTFYLTANAVICDEQPHDENESPDRCEEEGYTFADAEFIAATNPRVIKALCDEIDAVRSLFADMESAFYRARKIVKIKQDKPTSSITNNE